MHYTLIGMSGAGKSYVGRQLAAKLGYDFFDVDTAMESLYGKRLQEILDELGDGRFLEEQSQLILMKRFDEPHIIATGGSIVYTPQALVHLKKISKIIFLDVPLEVIQARIEEGGRGIVGLADKTFDTLYEERFPLYQKWADVTVPHHATPREIVERLLEE
jgi:shikimate kinase